MRFCLGASSQQPNRFAQRLGTFHVRRESAHCGFAAFKREDGWNNHCAYPLSRHSSNFARHFLTGSFVRSANDSRVSQVTFCRAAVRSCLTKNWRLMCLRPSSVAFRLRFLFDSSSPVPLGRRACGLLSLPERFRVGLLNQLGGTSAEPLPLAAHSVLSAATSLAMFISGGRRSSSAVSDLKALRISCGRNTR